MKIKIVLLRHIFFILICCRSFFSYAQTTVNLSTLVNAPAAPIVLQWHTSATPSSGTLLSNTNVTATASPVSYWAFFYDPINNCYSPGLKIIVVSSNCPASTVNLNSLVSTSPPAGTVLQWHTVKSGFVQSGVGSTLVSNPSGVTNGNFYPVFYDPINNCYSPVGTPVIVRIGSCFCYKPAQTIGSLLDTKHGITALGRAGTDNGNWPMARKGAWTALEAKTKGFVINRIPTTAQVTAIANPVEGMMVYDEEADCLKIYTTTDNGTTFSWQCFNTQSCPD